jgi:hypothetical protein
VGSWRGYPSISIQRSNLCLNKKFLRLGDRTLDEILKFFILPHFTLNINFLLAA